MFWNSNKRLDWGIVRDSNSTTDWNTFIESISILYDWNTYQDSNSDSDWNITYDSDL